MVKCWALHLEMKMESHLDLMKEQNSVYQMDPLMVLMMASLRVHCLETHWELMMELSLVPWMVPLMEIMMATLMAQHFGVSLGS